MAFTKIAAAGIGSTETVTLHSLEVLNNATVGGVLTYEDVTNVDSIGIVTARGGVLVGSGITLSKDGEIFATGISTIGVINSDKISLGDSEYIHIGIGSDLKIQHDSNNSIISNSTGELLIDSSIISLRDTSNNSRLRVEPAGNINITKNLNVVGVITATSFSGIDSDKISEGNTEAEVVDTGSDGHFKVTTEGTERLRIQSGGALHVPAGIGPQLRFENQHSVTTDAAISTFDDGSGTMLVLGSNFYIDSSGTETRYNTSEESSGIILNRNGDLNLKTGGTGATATTRMSINSDGIITKSAHPAFFAHMSASTSHDNGDFLKCNSVSEGVNTGSHYDTSNYQFTAPVAGVYLFFGAANIVAGSGEYARSFQVRLNRNGSDQQFQIIRQTINGLASSYPGTGSYSGIISLSANDVIKLRVNWETDGSGFGTTETIHLHGTCFGGYLIG